MTTITNEELKTLSVEELEEKSNQITETLHSDKYRWEPKLQHIYWREKEENGIDYKAYDDALKASSSAKRAITKAKNLGDPNGNGWPKRCEEIESPNILDEETTKAYKAKVKEVKTMLKEESSKWWEEKTALMVNQERIRQARDLRVNRNTRLEEELTLNTKALETIDEDLIKAIEKLKEEKVAREARLKESNEELKEALKVDINTLIDAIEEEPHLPYWYY